MYGKAFESMYVGSMAGAGLNVFAVWNYVLAFTRRGTIELNPRLVRAHLGGTEEEIVAAIEFLCKPDPESRCPLEEGRRMVKEGKFQYRVVNWLAYQTVRNAAELQEYNRRKQEEYRAKQRLAKMMTPKQAKAFEEGHDAAYAKRRREPSAREKGELAGAQDAVKDSLAAVAAEPPLNGAPTL